MALTALISAASYDRIARGRDWLNARQPAEEVLIIGASPGAANELTRSLAREKRASFGYHRLTLGQLASALAQPLLTAQRTVPLGALGVQAVANGAIHKLSQAGGLGRYVTITSGPGFARAIASVLTELRLDQIETDSLADVTPDLCPLLHAYKRELAEHGFTDWPGILHLAASAAADSGCGHQLLGLPTLFLDVPLTTASDTALVRALCSRSPESLLTVPTLDAVTLARLRSGLAAEIVDLDLRAASEPGLKQERRGLRSPQEYRSHLEEAFGRANVPVYFTRGAVRPDPAGRAFHALLCCATENLSARRFAEYLSLSQVPDAKPDGAPPEAAPASERWIAPDQELIPRAVAEALGEEPALQDIPPPSSDPDRDPVIAGQLRAPRRWERLLVEASVIGGRERWRNRITGLAQDLRRRLAEIEEENEAQGAILRRSLNDLEAFAAYALPLIDSLDALPKSAAGVSGSTTWGRLQHGRCASQSACCRTFRTLTDGGRRSGQAR
jgi:ATP-dependent helicase/nuclease subunit B